MWEWSVHVTSWQESEGVFKSIWRSLDLIKRSVNCPLRYGWPSSVHLYLLLTSVISAIRFLSGPSLALVTAWWFPLCWHSLLVTSWLQMSLSHIPVLHPALQVQSDPLPVSAVDPQQQLQGRPQLSTKCLHQGRFSRTKKTFLPAPSQGSACLCWDHEPVVGGLPYMAVFS